MTNRKELLREFLLMNLGTLLVSVGVYFFKFPNHFSMGGVSGLAVLLGKLLPQLSPLPSTTIINVLFLVLGFVMLNRGFGARTVYCSILSAGLIQLFEWAFPMDRPLTDQLMLELFFAVILPALGSAILFNIDASSGGTDIAAMILKKYTGLDVGRALLLSDVVIAAAALFVFDITAGLCSCWAWPSSRCWWIAPSRSLQPAQGLFSSSPADPEHVCDYSLPIPWAGAPPYGRPRALIPTQSTTWCSPSSPGGRPCFCAAT
ncbi:MAG: YitT family protein [Flavonifractor plautii]